MSTHVPARPVRAHRNRPWPGATVPGVLLSRLSEHDDPREQLAAVAMYHFDDLTRQIAWQVGDETAQDLVQDVVLRHLTRHDRDPKPGYAEVATYHRLRASLITSTRFAAIDHLRSRQSRADGAIADAHMRAAHIAVEPPTETHVLDADAAALHDGLRRIDARRALVIRLRLTGTTFEDIAAQLDVSLATAYKIYQKALRDVHPLLTRYVRGEYCSQYGPYLLLARDSRTAPAHEHPLAAVVGDDRARAIMLHIFGDPDVTADDGCPLCQRVASQLGAVLLEYLPVPLLLVPASGLVAGVNAWFSSVWGAMSGVTASKGVAVVAASALAIGGTVTAVRHASIAQPPARSAPAPVSVHTPQKQFPTRTGTRPTTRGVQQKHRVVRGPRSPVAEFDPAPASSPATAPKPRRGGGTAAAEFAP